ncbi:MAG: PEP-CTERM sorting domain-containing protein [Terriglobales bacterium]
MQICPRRWAVLGVAVLALVCGARADSLTFSFQLLPGQDITGSPGQTIGWGYSITNNSQADFLQMDELDPLRGFPLSWHPKLLFDFPLISPGTTFSEPFDPGNGTGFLELNLAPDATPGAAGTQVCNCQFTLRGQFYAPGDEITQNNPLGQGTGSSDYSASVGVVPEPTSLWLLGSGALLLLGWGWRRKAAFNSAGAR